MLTPSYTLVIIPWSYISLCTVLWVPCHGAGIRYVDNNEPLMSWSLPDSTSVRSIGSNYWRTKYRISKNRFGHSDEAPAVGYCRYHEQRKTYWEARNLKSRVVLL